MPVLQVIHTRRVIRVAKIRVIRVLQEGLLGSCNFFSPSNSRRVKHTRRVIRVSKILRGDLGEKKEDVRIVGLRKKFQLI